MKKEELREEGAVEGAKNAIISVAIIVGIITLIVGIAVAVYKYLTPDYLDDFDEFADPSLITLSTFIARLLTGEA